MDSVNLTFNAFLHRNFSSRYIIVPGGHEGVVENRLFRDFTLKKF